MSHLFIVSLSASDKAPTEEQNNKEEQTQDGSSTHKKRTKIKRESHRKWQMQFAYFMTRSFDGAKVLPIYRATSMMAKSATPFPDQETMELVVENDSDVGGFVRVWLAQSGLNNNERQAK